MHNRPHAWHFWTVLLLAFFLLAEATAMAADATGFSIIQPCGSPPFGPGQTDMHLHLTRFPGQRRGQELILMMPSRLPGAVTDLVDVPAKLCNTSSPDACKDAEDTRVQVLKSTVHYFFRLRISGWSFSGRFETKFRDGTVIAGTFSAKVRESKEARQARCE